MQKSTKKKVTLYSDGSSLGNPGPGGYGGILKFNSHEKEFYGGEPHTTNNRMELRGVIEGLKFLKEPCDITVVSDSSYVINAINSWLNGWIKRDFKNVKNIDLWKEYIDISKPHKITGIWVRGHNGHEENERCDTLAYDEAQRQKELLIEKGK